MRIIYQGERMSTSVAVKRPVLRYEIYAYADHVMSSKPNITTLTLESHITFLLNKTSEWLSKQEGALEMVRQSSQEVRCEREKFRAREKEIRTKREIKQHEEMEKKEVIEMKRIEKLEIETNQMMFYGLWQTVNQVNNEIAQLHSQKDQEEGLKTQLRFRKSVFKQTSLNKNVYNFSKVENGKRVQLSVEELKLNVISLVKSACLIPTPEKSDPHLLVGKHIKHKWLDNGNVI
ncbi:hypothetical protein DPMN_105907 [Dreissena polymorpha]|uniref:Uncharacterized protein n=1 Tax=Dreissena polymorpha TaxID=45954 RepID=A0A9D4K411_DREPO|nr:hypothetical protein DPMN_105907 [Dreissena polymorpha]